MKPSPSKFVPQLLLNILQASLLRAWHCGLLTTSNQPEHLALASQFLDEHFWPRHYALAASRFERRNEPTSGRRLNLARAPCRLAGTEPSSLSGLALRQEPAEPDVVDGDTPASDWVPYTLISRFVDNRPYYRHEPINGRSGAHSARSTLANWAGAVAWIVWPGRTVHVVQACLSVTCKFLKFIPSQHVTATRGADAAKEGLSFQGAGDAPIPSLGGLHAGARMPRRTP